MERPKLPEDDWQRSHAEWAQNRGAVEHLFEALAKELAPRMDGLFLARPELRKEAFDVSFAMDGSWSSHPRCRKPTLPGSSNALMQAAHSHMTLPPSWTRL
jgi:hypothetical protein